MAHTLTILVFLLLVCSQLFSQVPGFQETPCLSDELHQILMNTNPDYALRMETFEQVYRDRMTSKKEEDASENVMVYTIPVVVHVIHESGTPVGHAENLLYTDIVAKLDGMNDDFRHTSGLTFPNPLSGVDTEIEFCLAARDPNGNPTNGVVRHPNDTMAVINSFGESNTMKMLYYWNTSDYYNIYLVKNITFAGGFAYFASAHGSFIDGTVAAYFGGSGLWSHELGHAMNLYHTFDANSGNMNPDCTNNDCLLDGDRVCDTPPKENPGTTGGGCAAPGNSCTSDEDDTSTNNPYRPVALGGMGDQDDLLENYMDYTHSCYDAFTVGQKDRMRTAIDTYRGSYLTSLSCVPVVADDAAVIHLVPNDTCFVAEIGADVVIGSFGSNILTSADIEFYIDNVLISTTPWTGNLAYGDLDTLTIPNVVTTEGTHDICAKIVSPNGVSDGNNLNDEICQTVYVDLYCALEISSTTFVSFWIDSVAVDNIYNNSGFNYGYGNFISLSADLEQGYPVDFTLVSDFSGAAHWYIWIDYNQDYDFDDPDELVFSSYSNAIVNGSFEVPPTTPLGNTRMRIAMTWHSTGPSGTTTYGEVEDYTVNIVGPPFSYDVTIPEVGKTDSCGVVELAAEAVLYNLGSTTLTSADVEIYANGNLMTTIPWMGNLAFGEKDTLTSNYFAGMLGNYDLCAKALNPNGMTDENPSNDEACNTIYFDPYCSLTSNNPNLMRIDSVQLGTIENQTGNDGGYGNYINISTDLSLGYPVDFTLMPDYPGSIYFAHWYIWIDYNQDYDFDDPDELVFSSYSNAIVNGSFEVPPTTPLGNTRMRIAMTWYSTGPSGTTTYGEVEDYTVNIVCYTINNFSNCDYLQDFEQGTEAWIQETNEFYNWENLSGSTPAANTGPSVAFDGNTYAYINSFGGPNEVGILYSPCIDLSSLPNPKLSFAYHMWGMAMGTLEVMVSVNEGATWSPPVWDLSGDQGNTWHTTEIDLSAYANQTIQLQFKGTTGSQTGQSDMAIDAIEVFSTTTQWFADADGDGFGNPAEDSLDCNPPLNFVANNLDCDDNDPNNFPGNTETCDGIDNNCNGYFDEDCPGILICGSDTLMVNVIGDNAYHAYSMLSSDVIIPFQDTVEFTAGSLIELNNPFEVPQGSIFEARIDTCQLLPMGNFTPKIEK